MAPSPLRGVADRLSPAAPAPNALTRVTFAVTVLVSLAQSTAAAVAPLAGGALGSPGLVGLVVGTYLMAATVSGPLFGAWADRSDQQVVLRHALVLFAVGCTACAVAPSMGWLLAARAVQGVAGGGLVTVAAATAAAALEPALRPRYQGRLATTTSLVTVIGPVLAGLLVTFTSWRAVFAVACVAAIGVIRLLVRQPTPATATDADRRPSPDRHTRPERRPVDLRGAALLVAGAGSALGGIQVAAHRFGDDWRGLVVGGVTLAVGWSLLRVFVRHERRHPAPLMPVDALRSTAFLGALVQSGFGGAVLFGAPVQVMQYLGAGGASPVSAGLAMVPLFGGLALTSAGFSRWNPAAGRVRRTATLVVAAVAATGLGLMLLATVPDDAGGLHLVAGLVVLGAGLGVHLPATGVLAQSIAPRAHLGAAMSALMLARTLGGACGAAVAAAAVTVALAGDGPGTGTAGLVAASTYLAGFPLLAGVALAALIASVRLRPEEPRRGRRRATQPPRAGA